MNWIRASRAHVSIESLLPSARGEGARRADEGSFVVALTCALLAGCAGPQSALDPAGRGAERIATLFWWLTGGASVIWLAVVVLTLYALHRPHRHTQRTAALLIVGGGFVAPTVILTGLLVYALALLPDLLASPPGALKIHVSGEQWWWRVRYVLPNGEQVELANEIRLPLGEPVEVVLESPDVIHAFWIPSIAGKVDMIPGRVNRLTLEPTRTGIFHGVCAEYCGTSHAFMALDAVVLKKDEFRTWLERQRQPARSLADARDDTVARGRELFLVNGCGACHAIRGTPARGVIGPDLTHVGSRHRIGAGMFDTNTKQLARWIAETNVLKPGVHMPAFGMLPSEDIHDMAAYLEALQ